VKQKIRHFAKQIGAGLKQEYEETKQIPHHIKKRDFKAVKQQIGDIGKMIVIAFVWVLPAGAILSGFIVKFSQKMRPSAFQKDKTRLQKRLKEIESGKAELLTQQEYDEQMKKFIIELPSKR
jgi:hypothetical protein